LHPRLDFALRLGAPDEQFSAVKRPLPGSRSRTIFRFHDAPAEKSCDSYLSAVFLCGKTVVDIVRVGDRSRIALLLAPAVT
jgi:hypothetical protein